MTILSLLTIVCLMAVVVGREFGRGDGSRRMGLTLGQPVLEAAAGGAPRRLSVNWNGDEGDKKSGGK